MELIKLTDKTYYFNGPTNVGLYIIENNDIALIDTGFLNQAKEIYKIIKEKGFNLKYVINTHSHADHSSGNNFFIEKTGCKIIASKIERAFLRNHKLDLAFLYGGYPLDEFDTEILHIDEQREILTLLDLPKGLSYFKLPGHTHDMVGIKTDDFVYFVADAVGNTHTINKYHILLMYDVLGYLKSLEYIKSLKGKWVVPSHEKPNKDFDEVIKVNENKIYEISDFLLNLLKEKHTHDDILTAVFNHYNLKIGYNQYMIAGSTIRSYLAYLDNRKLIKTFFLNNKLYYEAV